MPLSKTEDLSDSNGEWVRSSQAWSLLQWSQHYIMKLLNRGSSNKAGKVVPSWGIQEEWGQSSTIPRYKPEWWRARLWKWHTPAPLVPLHVCMCACGKEKDRLQPRIELQNRGQPKYPAPHLTRHCCYLQKHCEFLEPSPTLGAPELQWLTKAIMWHKASIVSPRSGLLQPACPNRETAPTERMPGPKSAPRSRRVLDLHTPGSNPDSL